MLNKAAKLFHAKAFITDYATDTSKVDTSPYAGEDKTKFIPYKCLSHFYAEYEATCRDRNETRDTYAGITTFSTAWKELRWDTEGSISPTPLLQQPKRAKVERANTTADDRHTST
jgi:hypothetical protein